MKDILTKWSKIGGITLDSTRNIVSDELYLRCESDFAAANVFEKMSGLLSGNNSNFTENRPVNHHLLRAKIRNADIDADFLKARELERRLHSGELKGFSGKTIKSLVNIGIGGSFLGMKFLLDALQMYAKNKEIKTFFISNVDYSEIDSVLSQVDLEETLFIVSSKSFATLETLSNCEAVYTLLKQKCQDRSLLARHFVFLTSRRDKVLESGYPYLDIFEINEGVGGRFSIWSVMSLIVILSIGFENFEKFLEGGRSVDEAIMKSDSNIALSLAKLAYIHKLADSRYTSCVVSYASPLRSFYEYLQQMDMESNGKRLTMDGKPVDAGYVLWGGVGANDQHSYFQYLHQGGFFGSVDLIMPLSTTGNLAHQRKLFASCLSQAEALFYGNDVSSGYSSIAGGHSVNILFLDEISPHTLGTLVAIYEYKVIFLGLVWGINSFDQPSVGYAKEFAVELLSSFDDSQKFSSDIQRAISIFNDANDRHRG